MAVSRLKYPTFFNMSASKGGRASGGTVTTSGSYTIHTFSTANTPDWFIVNDSSLQVDILLVGGGGAGGYWGGGGGGGGFFSTTSTLTGGKSYPVWVGAGGVPSTATPATANPYYFGGPGESSQLGHFVALGGGGGAAFVSNLPSVLNDTFRNIGSSHPFQHGGSGGGGAGGESGYSSNGGAALTSLFGFSGTPQGNRGGHGRYRDEGGSGYAGSAGGGGAGTAGTDVPNNSNVIYGTNGGNGLSSSISGTSVTYAGGGGGSSRGAPYGTGGTGGGGNGADSTTQNNGTDGLGGGAGGQFHEPGSGVNYEGGSGGSGIVIVRYLT